MNDGTLHPNDIFYLMQINKESHDYYFFLVYNGKEHLLLACAIANEATFIYKFAKINYVEISCTI